MRGFDYSPFYRATVGFDRVFDLLDNAAGQNPGNGYPPYNIEKIGENGLRITLAVAGFSLDDLVIELVENQLTVRGKQVDDPDRVYLHRGIAARGFVRNFVTVGDVFAGLLIPVVESAADALVSGELLRVRRCADARCARVFYDASRNGKRRWCEMATCGNRAKAARHRQKVRQLTA